MTHIWQKFWETLVRWRTYLVNVALALLFVVPDILNSTEVLAVIPHDYQRWFLVAAFMLNILMRPRPASIASDPEVQVKKAIDNTPGPTTVVVKETGGNTTATIHA